MARPTKEEATAWMALVHQHGLDETGLTGRHCDLLWGWLKRVRVALPSAATAQRDRERRAKAKLRMRQRLITDFPEANQTESQPE